MKIFKAEQWNLDLLLPLFETYRLSQGMVENPARSFAFLLNRIRFSESVIFIATDKNENAVGFVQLYPCLSSLQLQRYWQLTDIFVKKTYQNGEIYTALIDKAKEFVNFTQSTRLIVEQEAVYQELWEARGFKLNSSKYIFELNL